jgi:predicted nucleotidyltransferase
VSIALLERAAAALDDLLPEVVFLGAAAIELWITDPAAPPVRPTVDVDVVVSISSRLGFAAFEAALRARGFVGDQVDGVICRWRHGETGLILDAMPARADILGFENRWQAAAIPHAIDRSLPSGRRIRAAPPPYLVATKLEAFKNRGFGDLLGSRDFADVIALIDGRAELVGEVHNAPLEVRDYIAQQLQSLLRAPRIADGLAGAVPSDAASQARVDEVILPTLRQLSQISDLGT